LCSASCADLLDLPSDPHLAEASAEPLSEGSAAREDVRREGPNPEPLRASGAGQAGGPGVSGGAAGEPSARVAGDAPAASPTSTADAATSPSAEPDAGVDEPEPAPDVPAEPPSPCATPEIVGPNGRCYLVVAETLSWDDARLGCQAHGTGWDLAAIRNQAVNDFVGTLTDAEAWLGGSDAEVEGTWRWVSDGAPFWSGDGTTGSAINGAFEVWNTDEPNGRANSDCARTVPTARTGSPLTWADLECFELLASLCEGPPLEPSGS